MLPTKIVKARAGLVLDNPFFASLALKLTPKEDPGCKTAWTDGKMLGYNPDYIEKLTLEETKGLLAHEVMHCALAHHVRREGREHKKWNMAGDHAINPILEDAGMTLPKGSLSDPAFKDMAAEAIYSRLPEPQDDGDQAPGGCGEVRDGKNKDGKAPSPAECTQQQVDWQVATIQAAQNAKSMGSLPAGIDRFVKECIEPKADWKELLRRFIDHTLKTDYTWSRTNRRFIHKKMYLPSLKGEELPPIVIGVDTSISINQAILDQFSAEITAILEDYQTSAVVIYCDTRVAHTEEFSSDDLPLKLNPKGGGGTDFRPPFEWVDEKNMTPSCFIYLTDLYCNLYPDEPHYPVLWASYGTGGQTPPFGEVINL
jgi:predicted metal-dependent peptidase